MTARCSAWHLILKKDRIISLWCASITALELSSVSDCRMVCHYHINCIQGRTFNWTILDMFELGVTDFVATEAFKVCVSTCVRACVRE